MVNLHIQVGISLL